MAENKYSTLSVAQLREIVKAQGIKNTSSMRKAQLVQIVTGLEEQEKARRAEAARTRRMKAPGTIHTRKTGGRGYRYSVFPAFSNPSDSPPHPQNKSNAFSIIYNIQFFG